LRVEWLNLSHIVIIGIDVTKINKFSVNWSSGYLRLYSVVILLICSIILFLSAAGDLSIDELYSLIYVSNAESVLDIFSIKVDNNHILNSVYLYIFRDFDEPLLFRLLSVLSGIASLFLVTIIAFSLFGESQAILALLLFGFSYPIVNILSEARGYAPAILMSLLAYLSLKEFFESSKFLHMVLFWLFSILAIMFQFTSVIMVLAFFFYSIVFLWQKSRDIKLLIVGLFKIHFVVFAFIFFAYIYFISNIQILGGPKLSALDSVVSLSSYMTGQEDYTKFGTLTLFLFVLLTCYGLYHSQLNAADKAFFVAAVFLSPMAVVVLSQPEYLYYRYYIVAVPFLYVLISHSLIHLLTRKSMLRYCSIALIIGLLAGNALQIIQLIRYGRGSYYSLVEHIISNDHRSRILVSSDQDHRINAILSWHAAYFCTEDIPRHLKTILYFTNRSYGKTRMSYVPKSDFSQHVQAGDWYIVHQIPDNFPDLHGVVTKDSPPDWLGTFKKIGRWRSGAKLSGFDLLLFRKE